MRKTCVVLVGIAAVLVAGAALAQAIPNWNAPATWTPAGGMVASAQADIGAPVPFIPITPCRVADTRGNGFTGAYGPPALAASAFTPAPISFTSTVTLRILPVNLLS